MSAGLQVSSYHYITQNFLKQVVYVMNGFKISQEHIYSSTNWYTFQGQGHLVSTWNYDLHVNVRHLNLDTQFDPRALIHHFCGVFPLGVWSRHHGIREPHVSARICLPGALTDSGAPARLVSGVPVCLYYHCHGKPPHHGHSDL